MGEVAIDDLPAPALKKIAELWRRGYKVTARIGGGFRVLTVSHQKQPCPREDVSELMQLSGFSVRTVTVEVPKL